MYNTYAYSSVENSSVASIQNRTAYYTLSSDTAQWTSSNDSATYIKDHSTLTFKNDHTGHATLARYIDDAPDQLTNNLAETEFVIEFSASESGSSHFDIVGKEIDETGRENPNSILRIERDNSGGKVYLYDSSEQTIDITQYTFDARKLKVHAVMNFTTKDMDIDIYSVDDSGNEEFGTSYRDVAFYNADMTSAIGLYLRAATGSTMTLSDAVLYQQGEASATRELYNLSTDINPSADESDANQSNWSNTHGDVLLKTTMNEGRITSLLHDCQNIDQSGERNAAVNFEQSTNDTVYINFDISTTADIDGNGRDGASLNHFIVHDSNSSSVLDFMAGYDGKQYGVWINNTSISDVIENGYTTIYDSNNNTIKRGMTTPKINVAATINFSEHTMSVTAVNLSDRSETVTIEIQLDVSLTNVASIESILHRTDQGQISSTEVSNLVITQDNTYTPVITPQGSDLTVEVGQSLSIATVIQYDTVTVEPTDNDILTCVFASEYSSVIVTGKAVGETNVTVTAYNYNGEDHDPSTNENIKTDTATITVHVINPTVVTPPPADTGSLTELNPAQPILRINFEDEQERNGLYKFFDEYGRTHDEDKTEWTDITPIDSGLTVPASPTPTVTPQTIPNGHISDNAFYSWLTPQNGTQTGNGYRGSFLELDNALIQRTDKIRVSYDFAFYNIVKAAGGENNDELAGIPLAISMTSEAEETSGIPYSFNSLAYDEIDADPSDLTSISKHLLTFMTGRPKRDADGVHFTDMTNRLAYYDPLYGEYRAISNWQLSQNAYNYFHVEAEVDFYNDLITFTITDKGNAINAEPFTATTTIPEHSSWNGFIIASNKWDNNVYSDINGQDTEHYAYLDNIVATKIAEEQGHLNPIAPTMHPIPEDAVTLVKTTDNATWVAGSVKELTAQETSIPVSTETPRNTQVNEEGETTYPLSGNPNFTYDIVTGAANDNDDKHVPLPSPMPSANGITSYTEFDFYLPKEGSKLTLYMTGSISGTETIGNAISISTAGINSWYGNKNYQSITDQTLDTGVWYTMQIVYDLNDTNMLVTVTQQNNNNPVADGVLVRSRNLVGGYYREVAFNPESIFTGTNGEAPDSTDSPDNTDSYEEFPHKEPSMALAYIANLRIYNRATIEEYYPEGATADTYGNVTINNEQANSKRLGAVVNNFVRDQVEGGSDAASDYIRSENYPVTPPKSETGKTFKRWKVIYSNADNESATRIKYAPVYEMLTADSITGDTNDGYYYKVFYTDLPILENNYKTIDWYVYNGDQFRMWGNFDLTKLPHMTGEAEYRIGYVVYNIPVSDDNIIALPQAHHEAMTDDDKAQPTATPLPTNEPTNPGAEAPDMTPPPNAPMPSSAPSPSNAPTPAAQ